MKRILVTYASTFGSTAEVAEAIGQELRAAGTAVDILPVQDVNDLGQYAAVVIGSGIYNGTWLPEAIYFLRLYESMLQQLPVAYFNVCMILYRDTPKRRHIATSYLESVRAVVPTVQPVAVGIFAGKLRYRNLQLLERFIFFLKSRLPWGDYRNWKEIRSWAAHIHPALVGNATVYHQPML